MNENKLKIVIHLSNQNEDYILECRDDWNVLKVKKMIHETHPEKPKVEDHRLVHKGNYLQDDEILSHLFQNSSSQHVIHLVPVSDGSSSIPSCKSKSNIEKHISDSDFLHQQPATASRSQSIPWTQWQPNTTMMYYQQNSCMQNHANGHEQYVAMWTQYHQQMSQYMHYYGLNHRNYHGHVPPQTSESLPRPEQGQQRAAPHAEAPEENPPINAQGGFAAPENGGAARDWVDLLFVLLRYGFLLSIIYFYSTIWRFLFIASFFLILYIYQSGFFQAQRRPWHPDELERREDPRVPPPVDDDDNNSNDENNGDAAPVEPPQPSVFVIVWCFITSFFTSLFPQPQPVA